MQPKLCLYVRELKVLQRRAETGFGTVGGAGYGSFSEGYQPADAADYPSTFQN